MFLFLTFQTTIACDVFSPVQRTNYIQDSEGDYFENAGAWSTSISYCL